MSRDRVSRHGTADAILDASRGLLSSPGDTGMREHLAGCARCQLNLNVWKSFAGVTRRLRAAEPPEDVVIKAKALVEGASWPTERGMNPASRYDSMGVPLAAGARGALSDQAVYQAEEYAVDLRVSREGTQVVIVGQITNLRRPTRRVAHALVTLLAGDRVVVRTFGNDRGEFQVEHREHERMWIELAPHEGRSIRVPVRPRQMPS